MIENARQPLLLFVAVFTLCLFAARGFLIGGDDLVYLDIAQTFLNHGEFKESGVHGEPRTTRYSVGQPIVDLPVARSFVAAWDAEPGSIRQAAHILVIALWSSLLAALQVVMFYGLCRALGLSRQSAVCAGIAFGLGTMALVYSQRLYADSTLALLLVTGVLAIIRGQREGAMRWWLLAGLSLGFGLLTKPYAVLLIAVIGLYVAFRLWRPATPETSPLSRRLRGPAACALFVVLAGAAQLYYNHWRFGNVLTFGYSVGIDAYFGFGTPLLVGAYGLLFSSGKGLFWYNPILLLGLWGCRPFLLQARAEGVLAAALVIVQGIVSAQWVIWHGDFAWGPRYLVSVLPFLALPMAFWIEHELQRPQRWLVKGTATVLLVLSVAVQGLGLAVDFNQYIMYASYETGVFPHIRFEGDEWPLRDDNMLLHFIPEFSPLAGHLWMLRVIRCRDCDLQRQLEHPPWHTLNKKWVPSGDRALPFDYNIWWLTALQRQDAHRLPAILIAYALLAIGIAAVYLLLRPVLHGLRSCSTPADQP